MTEIVKKPVMNEAAATAAWVLEELLSSTAFEHTEGKQTPTGERRDFNDNSHRRRNTQTCATNAENLDAEGYPD